MYGCGNIALCLQRKSSRHRATANFRLPPNPAFNKTRRADAHTQNQNAKAFAPACPQIYDFDARPRNNDFSPVYVKWQCQFSPVKQLSQD